MSAHTIDPPREGTVRMVGQRSRLWTKMHWQRRTEGKWHLFATSGRGVRHRREA